MAGVVGIFVDSFAEKQLRKLSAMALRRRKRIAARVQLQRRRRRLRRKYFVGGYLTRVLADERVRRAALTEKDSEESPDEVAQQLLAPEKRLSLLLWFGAPVPIFAKFGLLLLLSTIFLRLGAITFGGGYVMIPLLEPKSFTIISG